MSCALWLNQLGFSPTIIEREATLGGQLLKYNRINRWMLGVQNKTSFELANLYRDHIETQNISLCYDTRLTAIETTEEGYRLILQKAGMNTLMEVQALVIATGVRACIPENFSNKEEFNLLCKAKLIYSYPTDHLERLEEIQGKRVAVIGGGDNAHFTVNDIASRAERTFLITHSHPKAQKTIRQEVEHFIAEGQVVEYLESTIDGFQQVDSGIELSLRTSGSKIHKIIVDLIFIRTGFTANTEFLHTFPLLANIEKQARGHLITDSSQRTSIPFVYAIGDVTDSRLQSVVTAIAQGAIAARAITDDCDAKG